MTCNREVIVKAGYLITVAKQFKDARTQAGLPKALVFIALAVPSVRQCMKQPEIRQWG
jgi:hypothetical protein